MKKAWLPIHVRMLPRHRYHDRNYRSGFVVSQYVPVSPFRQLHEATPSMKMTALSPGSSLVLLHKHRSGPATRAATVLDESGLRQQSVGSPCCSTDLQLSGAHPRVNLTGMNPVSQQHPLCPAGTSNVYRHFRVLNAVLLHIPRLSPAAVFSHPIDTAMHVATITKVAISGNFSFV